jgi:TonB-dependent starch-binding outer membrane protein SusC
MKLLRSVLLSTLLLLVFGSASAQDRQIKGKITDSTGAPMQGVTIMTDKKTKLATSDAQGNYVINIDKNTSTLIFSYVGYTTQTQNTSSKSVIDVVMYQSRAGLDDVVVIGYGTQKKSHLTGSVSKYTNDRLDEIPVTRLDQALQGKIAGVSVQNLTSEAGATPRIRVRGLNSINASADPLVVVDGSIVPDGLAFVNMSDVASVEILKDAASSAIYGSRGANGVIIVTTKSGKSDKTRYNLKISNGWRTAYKTQDMMTVSEYVNLLFEEAAMRATDPTVTASQRNKVTTAERAQYILENTVMKGVPTDWQQQALRSAANVMNVQGTVSGGTKTVKYFLSGGYNKEEGLMYHSDYQKASLRAKLETELGKRVKLNININPTYSNRERPAVGYIDFVRFPSYLPAVHNDTTAAFVNQNPQYANIRPGDWVQVGHFNGRVYSGYMPDGTYYTGTSAVDPFSSSNNTPKSIMETRHIFQDEYRLLSSADITINFAKGLDFKSLASGYISYITGTDFAETNNNKQGDVNRGIYANRTTVDLLSENTLNYAKNIGKHSITALGGFTVQQTRSKYARTEGTNFPNDNIRTINNALVIVQAGVDATGNLIGTYTVSEPEGMLSYLGRVTYAYNDRYLFSASMRADGSSKFAPGHKWGYFPSASAGWVVSKENFMKNARWISQLKLRASYGATGNNRVGYLNSPNSITPPNPSDNWIWVDLLFPTSYVFGPGTGTPVAGYAPSPSVSSNVDVTWERTFQSNFGIDFSLFKNALSISADYYTSKTEKLLLKQSVLSFTGAPFGWVNIGKVQNKGLELEVTSRNVKTRNFSWATTANFATNKNRLLDLGGPGFLTNTGERNEVYINQVGYSAIRFFGFKTDGVWLSQAEADAAKAKDAGTSNATVYYTAGGLKIVDLNGDNKIDNSDRTEIGNPYPKFTWGLNNNISYKNFDLSFLFQGVQGVDVFNGDGFYNESRKYNRKYNNGNRWVSAANPGDGRTPYFTNGYDWLLTDYLIEDGSYFALREVVIGYKLPEKVAKTMKLSSLRVYASAQNLWIHWADSYRGINPEARMTTGNYGSPLIDGYQRGAYPMQRTVMVGLDINF